MTNAKDYEYGPWYEEYKRAQEVAGVEPKPDTRGNAKHLKVTPDGRYTAIREGEE